MRFASFLSGGFITAIVVNPPEKKLAKRTSVQWGESLEFAHNSGMAEAGGKGGRQGGAHAHPDFGRIESAAGQQRRAALLLANPNQTLCHHNSMI